MSEEIIKQENEGKEQPKPDIKVIQNENIIFRHELDPQTNKIKVNKKEEDNQ
jgi:hypothetical protein